MPADDYASAMYGVNIPVESVVNSTTTGCVQFKWGEDTPCRLPML